MRRRTDAGRRRAASPPRTVDNLRRPSWSARAKPARVLREAQYPNPSESAAFARPLVRENESRLAAPMFECFSETVERDAERDELLQRFRPALPRSVEISDSRQPVLTLRIDAAEENVILEDRVHAQHRAVELDRLVVSERALADRRRLREHAEAAERFRNCDQLLRILRDELAGVAV